MPKQPNVVSPVATMKFPFQDLLIMAQLKKSIEMLYPKLSVGLFCGKRNITLDILCNPKPIKIFSIARMMSNAFNEDVNTEKHRKTGCGMLMHVISLVKNSHVRIKIRLEKTCKKGDVYTKCLDRTGRRTKGIEKCEEEPDCGTTPEKQSKTIKNI